MLLKDRIDAEFALPPDNQYQMIIDESLSGASAYFGHLDDKCYWYQSYFYIKWYIFYVHIPSSLSPTIQITKKKKFVLYDILN